MNERLKQKLCLHWLRNCKALGWKKQDMPLLCDLFWKHEGWKYQTLGYVVARHE